MGKYVLVVNSNATDGKEDEYNAWYNDVHLGEVLQVPGFVAAQRFSVAAEPTAGDAPEHKYLAIYELETEQPQQSLAALGEAVSSGKIAMSDAINMRDVAATLYGPVSDRVTA